MCSRGAAMTSTTDGYDCLFGHFYNSIGPSGSERHAIFKMIYAGAHLPRATKNLMKKHGVYPLGLLTIFKAALPYKDGSGKEVPYANELRHRPSYSSNGNTVPKIYAHRELEYHLYDEQAHLFRMIRMAQRMENPPPVTLLRMSGLRVPSGGKDRVKSVAYTNIRIHGKPGERFDLTVDLGRSYDLKGRSLTYHAERVYPEQSNILVKAKCGGKFRITAAHDPKLPRGRFPVILWVENGTACPGNPVFVNFHWPAPGQPEKPPYFVPYEVPDVSKEYIGKFLGRGGVKDPKAEVNRNLKPIITTSLEGDTARAAVGETLSFTVKGEDPEGCATRFYLWSTGVGTIDGNTFRYVPKESARGKTIPFRLICSDGTGGYRGLTVKIQVR